MQAVGITFNLWGAGGRAALVYCSNAQQQHLEQ
jgi:hypothetical protein